MPFKDYASYSFSLHINASNINFKTIIQNTCALWCIVAVYINEPVKIHEKLTRKIIGTKCESCRELHLTNVTYISLDILECIL